jgi:biotin transport system substrate-specific component
MKIKTRDMILTSLFSALMAVGAIFKVPLPSVPLSLQPFFCALAGIILGSRLGALSMIVYAALGLTGVPVFTQGGGPSYILNPSFGYILGFIAGTYVIGKISEAFNEINLRNSIISVMSGLVVIYMIGVPYMYIIINFYIKKPMTMFGALSAGLFPFIVKDIILYFTVSIVAVKIVPVLRKSGLARAKC